MSYEIELSADGRVVIVKNTGKITYESIEKVSIEALAFARANKANLFLSDCTSVTNPTGIFDAYKVPELYDEISPQKGLNKLAILLSDEVVISEEILFFETVCVNRGRWVKVFNNKEAALGWLLS